MALIDKNNFQTIFRKRLKIFVLIAFFILLWIIVVKIVGNFVVANADENWNSISLEKTDENRLKVV